MIVTEETARRIADALERLEKKLPKPESEPKASGPWCPICGGAHSKIYCMKRGGL